MEQIRSWMRCWWGVGYGRAVKRLLSLDGLWMEDTIAPKYHESPINKDRFVYVYFFDSVIGTIGISRFTAPKISIGSHFGLKHNLLHNSY